MRCTDDDVDDDDDNETWFVHRGLLSIFFLNLLSCLSSRDDDGVNG